ncbi:MAG: Fe-S-containing protein [Clostridiales Family XIII bacterium]|nr:Fe-S-containing protein [Clostridiales Family XIII bacterium]
MSITVRRVSNKAQCLSGRCMAWGILLGSVCGLVLAALRYTTALINRELWSMGMLFVAIVSGILMIVILWFLLQKKMPKALIYATNVISFLLTASVLFYITPDIFLYPTEFVMSDQSVFSTDFLFKLIGYLAGMAVVVLTGVAVCKAGKTVSLRLLKILLTAEALILIAHYAATIAQLLIARRLIPMSHGLFEFIKITINHSAYFLYGALVIAVLLIVRSLIHSRQLRTSYPNPAERRKDVAGNMKLRRWCAVALAGFVLAVLCTTVIKDFDEKEVILSPAEEFAIEGGDALVAIENVNDGHLHRFVYTASDNTEVRFIVVKKNDVAYGVGLDACDICGPTGYYERDDEVICKLCDVVMNRQTIGFKGGCNPVPLKYTLDGANMVIDTNDLENEKNRFK